MRMLRAAALAALVPLVPASAQQFQHASGALPGTARWTEGVELADVDGDGDLDVFFAEGEGFASAGTKRQNVLIINKRFEVGPNVYADESVARLGAHVSNAKAVVTGDVDGDGWVDALFVNAFDTDPPSLYINRGNAQPGFFDLESASRGLTEALNASGAQFGDVDDDGDLDLLVCDSGPNLLSGPGGKPRLYLNDGSGHFSEAAAALGAPIKVAHMDVQLADVDLDWDLDFVGLNRATNAGGDHYLLLNDGSGTFTNQSSLLPGGSGATYEAEVGDLDGDSDFDLFYVSLQSFQEGPVENDLVPTATLGFTAGTPEPGFVDDNEIGLLDYDTDGDLDVVVGSLGSTERLYRNDGALAFTLDASAVQAVSDSTLDLAIGDLDNDGDYDLVTAQGESNPGQWANKLYLNSGPADTLPPVVDAVRPLGPPPSAWPLVLHARAHDQVVDDGVSYVHARAVVAPLAASVPTVDHSGGAFVPANLAVATGTRVHFTNLDANAQSVTSLTAPWTFDLPLAPSGGTAEVVFVSPGTYTYESTTSGASATVVVTGAVAEVAGLHAGGGIHRFAIPPQPRSATGALAVELFFRDFPGNESVSASFTAAAPDTLGTVFCDPAVPNSSGLPGVLSITGSDVVADDDLVLAALQLPSGSNIGYFLMGTGTNTFTPPGSAGPICIAPGLLRFLPPVSNTSELGGGFTRDVGTSGPVSGAITAGSTWSFQAWHRDGMGPSNLTHAVSIAFQ